MKGKNLGICGLALLVAGALAGCPKSNQNVSNIPSTQTSSTYNPAIAKSKLEKLGYVVSQVPDSEHEFYVATSISDLYGGDIVRFVFGPDGTHATGPDNKDIPVEDLSSEVVAIYIGKAREARKAVRDLGVEVALDPTNPYRLRVARSAEGLEGGKGKSVWIMPTFDSIAVEGKAPVRLANLDTTTAVAYFGLQ